jgi:hypothetical protein
MKKKQGKMTKKPTGLKEEKRKEIEVKPKKNKRKGKWVGC